MKKTIFTSVIALTLSFITLSETFAQDRNGRRQGNRRGNSQYNSNQGHRSHNHSRNPRVNHTNRNTNHRNNNGRVRHNNTHNNPRTNPRPHPRTNGRSVYAGRQYNPNRAHSYSYNNRPHRNYYGTRNYHRPYNFTFRPYSTYTHRPYGNINFNARRRYLNTVSYFQYLRQYNRDYLYLNWIFFPSTYNNGYYNIGGYPYFVYNGYQHRYSNMDQCNYQLIDQYTHQVIQSFYGQMCNFGYDSCSFERDRMNSRVYENRYVCAETFRNQSYDFNYPTYDYQDNYYDYEDEYYYDNYNY